MIFVVYEEEKNDHPFDARVIILGAGSCGLLLSVPLSKQSVQVQLLNDLTELDEQLRACHYGTPATCE